MTSTDASERSSGPVLLRVWVDQELCTGDGLCVQDAPEVFEFDVDGLAYVKGSDGELVTAPGGRVDVPESTVREVLESAKDCPGRCIHVERASDGVVVGGPDRAVPVAERAAQA